MPVNQNLEDHGKRLEKKSSWIHHPHNSQTANILAPCGVNGKASPSNQPSKNIRRRTSQRPSDGGERPVATWIQTPRHSHSPQEITELPLARSFSLSLQLRRNGQPLHSPPPSPPPSQLGFAPNPTPPPWPRRSRGSGTSTPTPSRAPTRWSEVSSRPRRVRDRRRRGGACA